MQDARAIIDLWPNAEAFGRDLGLKAYSHGRMMKMRNSIHRDHWPRLLEAAKERGIELSEDDLIRAHARESERV